MPMHGGALILIPARVGALVFIPARAGALVLIPARAGGAVFILGHGGGLVLMPACGGVSVFIPNGGGVLRCCHLQSYPNIPFILAELCGGVCLYVAVLANTCRDGPPLVRRILRHAPNRLVPRLLSEQIGASYVC